MDFSNLIISHQNTIQNSITQSTSEMSADCPICCDTYNKSTRDVVKCYHDGCGFEACKSCTRTYLLGSTQDPHCMKCHKAWSHEFMIESLNRSYMNADYRKHRANLLVEREIARLQESMQLAGNERQAREFDQLEKEKDQEIKDLRARMKELERERYTARNRAWALRHPDQEEKQAAKFVMPCPREDCRGFLSSQYKCEICKFHTCPHCLEVIGESKEGHVCDPDTVATAQAIKNETKPCPKCGERISKISGCDQMWCISCHTAFSWRTGQIDTGIVHNPHFFQFQRNGGDAGPGGGGGQVGLNMCNQEILPYWYNFNRTVLRKIRDLTLQGLYSELYRTIAHISRAEIIPLRDRIRNLSDNEGFRVKYILNEIDRATMAKKLFTNDKIRRRLVESINILELIENVGRETLLGLYNSPHDDLTQQAFDGFGQMQELVRYCNLQLDSVSKLYKVQQLWVCPETMKFNHYKR